MSKGQPETTAVLSVTATSSYSINGHISGIPVTFLVDTGSIITIIKTTVWTQADPNCRQLKPYHGPQLVGVDGTALCVRGEVDAEVLLGGKTFHVSVIVVDQLSADAILGLDFLKDHQCTINITSRELFVSGGQLKLPLVSDARRCFPEFPLEPVPVSCVGTVQVPPFSEMEIDVKTPVLVGGTWMVERIAIKSCVVVARAVVCPSNPQGVCVRVINPTPDVATVYKGTKIAVLEPVDDIITAASVQQQDMPPRSREDLRQVVEQCQSLLPTEREELFELLDEYQDILATSSSDLGRTTKVQHRIHTSDHPPVRQPVRRAPAALREQAREELQRMVEKGVVQPSSSPWASPLVLVRKKDGSVRFCVDYHQLNGVTRKDAYPIPRIDETLDTLAGSCIFTTLDLLSGYWQVEMHPADKEKTAVCTPHGLFEFNVMPFGLCNAPATFQRLMDCVLAGLQWQSCLVYLDDVIVLGRSFPEHLHNLRAVFDRLREAGLKLFLAIYIVSEEGVSTDPAKVQAVTNWPTPTTQKQVQQFLGAITTVASFRTLLPLPSHCID